MKNMKLYLDGPNLDMMKKIWYVYSVMTQFVTLRVLKPATRFEAGYECNSAFFILLDWMDVIIRLLEILWKYTWEYTCLQDAPDLLPPKLPSWGCSIRLVN